MSHRRQADTDLGWIAFLLFMGGFVGLALYNESRPHVFPRIRGRVEQPFLGDPVLVMTVFHQHPGNLRKGTLQITISGPQVQNSSGSETRKHSFELWEPNEEHAVLLNFPLRKYDPTQEIPVSFSIKAAGIKDSAYEDAWSGAGWSSNQK
ncbi:hypothetical protein [Planctomicrobium sp. SH527]|uniref:hypothetical protein n=1 Tax=Planctomicrobium sp. SH527 TaxID=3448123 RepID=UPI003F5C2F4B